MVEVTGVWCAGGAHPSFGLLDTNSNRNENEMTRVIITIRSTKGVWWLFLFFFVILLLGKNIYSWMAWRSRDKYCVVSFWKVIGNIWTKRIVDRGEWVLDNNWNWNIYLGFLCSFNFTNILKKINIGWVRDWET